MRLKNYEVLRFINWNVILCISHSMASKNSQVVMLICIMSFLCTVTSANISMYSFGVNS